MCIYYLNRPGLTYNNHEHIFLAGIGGQLTLPKGYVSDQFNNSISRLEQEFMRDGIISAPRQIIGPGKRGSLNPTKATKSKVHLITDPKRETTFALGYTSNRKVIEIPHIKLNTVSGEFEFSFPNEGAAPQEVIDKFKYDCSNSASLNFRILSTDRIPENIILIGIQSGIEENFNCFVLKNEANNIDINLDTIKRIGNGIAISNSIPQNDKYLPMANQKADFKLDYLRIFGKIAFNFLAYLKGPEFVGDEQFDPIRNWIINGGDNQFAELDTGGQDLLANINIVIPEDSHVIYLSQSRSEIFAQVLLYSRFSTIIRLSKTSKERLNIDGLICDWKNRHEQRLAEFIATQLNIKSD